MFFQQEREHFFRPLTGKYREHIVECLKELYQRLYSSANADYGHALVRDQLIEIFQEALVRGPQVATENEGAAETSGTSSATAEDDAPLRFRTSRDQAVWILNQLLEHGWLEKQVDQATLHSTFSFTRFGREFTEPFVSDHRITARTRHRNTRNTRNALESFCERGDVYDLLDAFEYSERIISDFTDVIAELDERKRDLVREMEDQLLVQHASEAFFDFMENRFQPDLSVRLSADNVERHRDRIEALIRDIRRKDTAFKAATEKRLRELMPEQAVAGQSLLWWLLDGIEQRMRNAAEIMLPALRKSLQSFTKRADIIIRQMSYLASQRHNNVLSVCKKLAEAPAERQDALLSKAGELMAVPEFGYVDPSHVRMAAPRARQNVATALPGEKGEVDLGARKNTYIQQVLDQAFLVNQQALRGYIGKQLSAGKKISTRELHIESASDLLAVAHAIGLGAADSSVANTSSDFRFVVQPDDQTAAPSNDSEHTASRYFEHKDHFTFELVAKHSNTESADAAAPATEDTD
ncbi:Wadjet anti-phage system protein JetA family protein [Oceanobacter kriegii]|uniref:Wadjet anti-phage system protein JetA family protein n=1 Tax=Oceanobacter kriegii TaxID=64972 RepID=UPI0004062841|nr:Wadjet anti-phage system protein JetA family protein [Oceanobacter kriegii]